MKAATPSAAYAVYYAPLAEVARSCGYALAIHGTMARDCDLIAVPWTDEAVSPRELVEKLKTVAGACYGHPEDDHLFLSLQKGTYNVKPHGRRAVSLHLTDRGMDGPYFDVSIMPRQDARSFVDGDGI